MPSSDYVDLGGRPLVTEAETKKRARDRVAAEADRGRSPHDAFTPSDLKWAFDERLDELEQLEAQAVEVAAEKQERQQRLAESQALRFEVGRVLREWDVAAAAERQAAAETEARRRLGL